jgi:uncharacterized protein (TIGR02145 family)
MDPRDGQIYRTLKAVVKGNPDLFVTVMAQNLNVGTMVTGGTGQNNDDVLEKYCYNDNPENCKMYGGLYQWSEAMGLPSRCNTESCADLIADTNSHQGLCPDGWRVLTRNDFNIVLNSVQDGITGVSLADMRSGLFGGTNKTGYTLLGGGGYIKLWGGFAELGKTAYWYFSSESLTAPTSGAGAAMSNTSTTLSAGTSPKINAVSLRCVKAE